MYEQLISPAEMAKRCGLSFYTIKKLCQTGYGGFPSTKVGTHYRMDPDRVNAWIADRVERGLPLWESR